MSIASEISRIQTAKANLKTAIEGKGVTVPSATTIDGYASLVNQVQAGGFRCTNKIFLSMEPLLDYSYGLHPPYNYTFDGTLDSAAIGILNPGCFTGDAALDGNVSSSNKYTSVNGITITADTLMFQDKFCEPAYMVGGTGIKLVSNRLTFTATDLHATISINNQGVLTWDTDYYMDPAVMYGAAIVVIFKGTDGSYDFDTFGIRLYYDD